MISEYHRPKTIAEALALLSRSEPLTIPLAGGMALDRSSMQPVAVVDLQDLGLQTMAERGKILDLGAMVTLQSLLEQADQFGLPPVFKQVIEREATYNLRQAATLAGTVVAADGRSPLTTALLALDAQLLLLPGDEELGLGDLLPLRLQRLRGRLITRLSLLRNVRLAFESVARTPADQPIVCAALAAWPSGRVRLALGGFGHAPSLAFDGTEADGLEIAASSAYAQAGDEWASAEYRKEIAGILAQRCRQQLSV